MVSTSKVYISPSAGILHNHKLLKLMSRLFLNFSLAKMQVVYCAQTDKFVFFSWVLCKCP